jgi:hypothetical protein
MQRVTLVRYTTKPGQADANEALSRAVFDELKTTRPDHVAYALFRKGDEFLHVLVNTKEDSADAIVELPSFKAFSKDINTRCDAPPQPERFQMELVKSYGFPA